MNKLMFLVKWQLKFTKQKTKITLVKELQQILKLEYRLDILFLKSWADNLVLIFINNIETNPNNFNENPV